MVNLVLLVQFDETGKGIHGPDSRLSGRVSDQQLKSVDCVRHPVAQLCQCKLKGVVEKIQLYSLVSTLPSRLTPM